MSSNDPEFNPDAKAALLETVQNQLRSPESKEVRAEYDRLLGEGLSKKQARESIALVLAVHIARMMRREKPFDYAAYLAELRKLPEFDEDQPI